VAGEGCCLGRPSRGRRVVVRARSMQGLVEGRAAVGSLMVLMRCWVEGLVVGGILGRAEMVSCLTKIVEVREAVDTMGVLRREWVVGA
jgi:hypothetical protein